MYDKDLVAVWGVCSLVVGLALLIAGARAAGSALLGSVAGAIVGTMIVSSNFDLLPIGGICGATVGAVVFGCIGLAWTSSASGAALKGMAVASLLLTALVVGGILFASGQICLHHRFHRDQPCLRVWNDWTVLAALLFNAVFVVSMFLGQRPRESVDPASGGADTQPVT